MTTLKSILKFLLYAGAVACCAAGLSVICVVISNFREPYHPEDWPYELALAVIYISLASTPAFMFVMGMKTRTWQWAFIGIVEAIVIAVALYALLVLLALTLSFHG